jgi:hypothetical protein
MFGRGGEVWFGVDGRLVGVAIPVGIPVPSRLATRFTTPPCVDLKLTHKGSALLAIYTRERTCVAINTRLSSETNLLLQDSIVTQDSGEFKG